MQISIWRGNMTLSHETVACFSHCDYFIKCGAVVILLLLGLLLHLGPKRITLRTFITFRVIYYIWGLNTLPCSWNLQSEDFSFGGEGRRGCLAWLFGWQKTCENYFWRLKFANNADVSCIDDEFHTVYDILQGPQLKTLNHAKGEISTTGINDEIDKIVTKATLRDTKYRLDTAEQADVDSASDVMEHINKRAKSDQEERGKKKRKRAIAATNRMEGDL